MTTRQTLLSRLSDLMPGGVVPAGLRAASEEQLRVALAEAEQFRRDADRHGWSDLSEAAAEADDRAADAMEAALAAQDARAAE